MDANVLVFSKTTIKYPIKLFQSLPNRLLSVEVKSPHSTSHSHFYSSTDLTSKFISFFSSTRMTPLILDGKVTSETLQKLELAPACAKFQTQYGRSVGLAVVVVGSRKDSATYVRMKQKASANVGIESWKIQITTSESLKELDEDSMKEAQDKIVQELYDTIHNLNARNDVDGIIVQLPLPSFCNSEAILASIDPSKDVDGLHPENHAALFQFASQHSSTNQNMSFSVPCTPAGCIMLLDHHKIPIEGKHVVILGRSQIVGLPVSLLFLQRNATVTICHSRTQNLPARIREADIVLAAIGRAEFVKGDWIKPGAVVIDVGINPKDDPSKKAGYRLVGDVDYSEASRVASAITPVPGGIGPMTVAMLLRNTIDSAYRRVSQSPTK